MLIRGLAMIVLGATWMGCAGSTPGEVDASVSIDGAVAPDAPVDAAPAPDAELYDIGEPCTQHSECGDGFCVEGAGGGGGVCSRRCDDDCPVGFDCRDVTLPDEQTKLCIPTPAYHCLRCTSNAQCPGGACLEIDGQDHCAPPCQSSTDCPSSYTCAVDASGVNAGMFCQPVTGSCTCDPSFDGASRTCFSKNAIGTCWGTQLCDGATGWGACNAAVAEAEICDGIDNDCNFVIDDGVGGGATCQNTVAGVGTCDGIETCAGTSGFVCQGPTPMLEACNFLDDDCDGSVDEEFADLGTLCSAGQGACLAYGTMRCTADTLGTECSAVAGTPTAEACNGIDDDCMGDIDEDFPTLGDLCTSGTGICARLGTVVCTADTLGTECSATPGTPEATDVCNYADDDCDGIVDNGFLNPISGQYDADVACGSCEIDCTTLYDAPNASGVCVVSGTPQCALSCDPGAYDLNGSVVDGCEFILDTGAVYVSSGDPGALNDSGCGLGPVGTGVGRYPCRTIAQGLARAATLGRTRVLVADGTYDEAVTIVGQRNLLGGYYADTWERHLATTATVIQGVSSSGNHDRTVIANSVTAATLFEGFVVRGSFNAKPGGNSYAMHVVNSGGLTIRNNVIQAGRGGSGAAGAVGNNGATGVNGTGRDSSPTLYDAKVAEGSGACNTSNNRQYANGGARTCGGTSVNGGNGGGNRCPPVDTLTEYSGLDGAAGVPSGGGGGDAGDDMVHWRQAFSTYCTVPSEPSFGRDGVTGAGGGHAAAVAGCSSSQGTVSGGHWVNGTASTGGAGQNGRGGGGGGGGGGSHCDGCADGQDRLGGHGGGGGSGGCGGAGGVAGGGGGGVFGIFIAGGSPPTVTGNVITQGDGGAGGRGGNGGAGGLGGAGAGGGASEIFCAGKAGRGGDGGAAGHGAGGGGGCGGSSFGIYTSGVGNPNYCGDNSVSGGTAGPAGEGGFSGGSSGGAGTAGTLTTCSSN